MTEEHPVSAGGLVFQSLAKDVLDHEFGRRKNLEARGAVLLAASSTMTTIVLALTVLVGGDDFVLINCYAAVTMCAALAAFVLSATAAIFVQVFAFKYDVIDQDGLDKIVNDDDYWYSSANTAVRDSVDLTVRTIRSLRKGSRMKSLILMVGLGFQLCAIGLLSGAIGAELVSRLQAGQ